MKKSFLAHHLKAFFVSALLLSLVAFVGMCLWIFEVNKAVSFPAWVHAIWAIADIVFIVLALIHLAAFVMHKGDSDAFNYGVGGATSAVVTMAIIMGIPGGFGFLFLLQFFIFAGMAAIDGYMLFNASASQKASETIKGEQSNG